MEGKIWESGSSLSESDGETGSFEFAFFSSSSSFLSSSSSSFFSDGDLWTDSSFTFSSDDDLSIRENKVVPFNPNYGIINQKSEEASTVKEYRSRDKLAIKITIDKNDSSKSSSQFIYEKGNTTMTKSCDKISEAVNDILSSGNDQKDPFCDICGEVFNSQATLDVHKLNHLISETYTCEICQHVSKNREDYALHFKIHDQSSLTFTGVSTSKQKKFPSVPYRCDTCGKTFRFSSSFKRHVEKHTLSHTCNICNSSFPTQLLCHQHKLKHFKKKTHKCEVCSKVFQRPHQLSIHMQVHATSEKKYHCKECQTVYCYKTSLMRHQLKYHSPTSKKFQCDICGELFKNKKMLNGHVILHTAKKLIQCSDCSQTFKYRSSYHRHRVIHQGSKPYRCSNCGQLFKTESLLKVHKAQHVANDEFVCTICDKSFAFQSFLDQHMLIHQDDTNKSNTTDQSD